MCTVYMQELMGQKKKLDPLELEFTKHCDAITWEPVLGPLQEQQLLATERSPQL